MVNSFINVLNMNLTASYVIVFIMIVRLPLKKVPKIISYVSWCVAAFRLVCPISFESIVSLLPTNASPIPPDIGYQQIPQINSGITAFDTYINSSLPTPIAESSINPIQSYTRVGGYIWIFGIITMVVYSIASMVILKYKLKSADNIEKNIYVANNLKTPFVLGIINPKIFLPSGLTDNEKNYILRHEQTHIRRKDPLIKQLAFWILCIHWFNPLVWIAFILMGIDMELSCDERVIKEMGGEVKKSYSMSLLSLATEKRILNGSPLAFGEGNVKRRIKNVLNYKKSAFWFIAVAVVAVFALSIGLLSNPKSNPSNQKKPPITTPFVTEQPTNSPTYTTPTTAPTVTTPPIFKPTVAKWSHDQNMGADGVDLDYASSNRVIFHGYYGLFVYDINKRKLIRSVDLKSLQCNMTQGDDYCEVMVSKDGNTVLLHRLSSKNMYLYNVADNTLQESTYQPMTNRFCSSFVQMEDVIPLEKQKHSYSALAVKFGTDDYAYLYTLDWTVGTITYVRKDKEYRLFDIK